MNSFLEQLAIESGIIDAVSDDAGTETVGDLLEEHYQQPAPVDMIAHAQKSREIADQLEELAKKAESLAEEDKQYSSESIKLMRDQFMAICGAHDVHVVGNSFESAIRPAGQIAGIASDARYTATNLRANADCIDKLSTEAGLMDLFINKDKAIDKAIVTLQREMGALKGVHESISQTGVVVRHQGVSRFMTVKDKPVEHFDQQIDFEVEYLDGVVKYIKDNLATVTALKAGQVPKPVPDTVNTAIENNIRAALGASKPEQRVLLGNFAVANFVTVEVNGWQGKMTAGDFALYVVGSSIKATVAGIASGIVGFVLAGPAVGAILATAAQYGTVYDAGLKARQHILDKSDKVGVMDLAVLEKTIKTVAGLKSYAKTDDLYKEIQAAEKDAKELPKDQRKIADENLSNAKKALGLLKERVFYLTTQTARMLEQMVRSA